MLMGKTRFIWSMKKVKKWQKLCFAIFEYYGLFFHSSICFKISLSNSSSTYAVTAGS
jgi:hypothetical protein